MTYPIAPAHWDSQFFCFPIGNIELPSDYDQEKFETTLREAHSKFRLLFVAVQGKGPDAISPLGKMCPCYVRKLFLKKDVPRNIVPLDSHVRVYTSTFCTPTLERLAVQSGLLTQFRLDPELAPHFEQLFLTWINFAVTKELADSIWTYHENDRHLGLVTIRSAKQVDSQTGRFEKEGRIGMLSVDSHHRRRGIGSQLIRACDFWCSSLDIPTNAIVTQQDNEAAIALCKQLGFRQDREVAVYHYWSPGWIYDTRSGWGVQQTR